MRKFNVKVNGQNYEVEVDEILNGAVSAPVTAAQPVVDAAPAPAPVPQKTNVPAGGVKLEAPMPGTLLDFKVANGAKVSKGQPVLILEAMKMENEIVSPADGAITFVAAKGATVNSGDVIAVIA